MVDYCHAAAVITCSIATALQYVGTTTDFY